jgi:hypothetical protein
MSLFQVRALPLVFLPLLIGFGILGCGGGDEAAVIIRDDDGPAPTPAEARTALNEGLQSFNDHCLTPTAQTSTDPYPISVFGPGSNEASHQYQQLQALTRTGLLDRTVVDTTGSLPIHRFALTSMGRESQYEIVQGSGYTEMFCYATPHVTRLDSIEAIYNAGPNPLARVWFEYGYKDLGAWVESAPVQRTFSGLESLPSPQARHSGVELLVRVDSAWVDRRLTGYERPPDRPTPPSP